MPQPIDTQAEALTSFLQQSQETGLRPILWVGAGASAAAGYPTLAGIETVLKQKLPESRASGWALIEEFVAAHSRAGLDALLFQEIGEPRSFAPVHTAVARLAEAGLCPCLFTTNYDRLIENALTDAGIPFVAIRVKDDFTLQDLGQIHVLRLHRAVDNWQSAVLSTADYEAFNASYPRLMHQLDVNLRTRPILYIGCSMRDPRLLDWLSALPDRRDLPAGRAVLTRQEWSRLAETKRRLLDQANIQPVLVPDQESVTHLLLESAKRLAPV